MLETFLYSRKIWVSGKFLAMFCAHMSTYDSKHGFTDFVRFVLRSLFLSQRVKLQVKIVFMFGERFWELRKISV